MSNGPISPEMAAFASRFIAENRAHLHIDGFGPGSEPAPPPPDISQLRGVDPSFREFDDEGDPLMGEPPPSPLMELGMKATPRPAPPPDFTAADLQIPTPVKLAVSDRQAMLNGRWIELTVKECSAIGQIIALALIRQAKADYAELMNQVPKRPYVRRKKGVVNAETVPGIAPRGGDRVRRRRARRNVPGEGPGQAVASESTGGDRQGDQGAGERQASAGT